MWEKSYKKWEPNETLLLGGQKESIFVTTKAELYNVQKCSSSVVHYLLGCYSWLKKRGDSENGQEIGRCHPPFANYRM